MVFVSTYLYGEPEYLPVDEKHKCVTTTPYHLCKKIGEDICEFYSRNFGVDVAVIRPFNVYGKGQNRDFLLPKVYYQVADDSVGSIEVFNLAPRRDYVYVEDLVDMGCYIQVNASSIMGKYGFGISHFTKKLLKNGLVHFVATDAHDCKSRAPELLDCRNYVARKYGDSYSQKIFYDNQMSVLENEVI